MEINSEFKLSTDEYACLVDSNEDVTLQVEEKIT